MDVFHQRLHCTFHTDESGSKCEEQLWVRRSTNQNRYKADLQYLLLYAPIIFRQVCSDVPVTGSRVGEVKGRGAVCGYRHRQRQAGVPKRRIGEHQTFWVYNWRGTPSNMSAKERWDVRETGKWRKLQKKSHKVVKREKESLICPSPQK